MKILLVVPLALECITSALSHGEELFPIRPTIISPKESEARFFHDLRQNVHPVISMLDPYVTPQSVAAFEPPTDAATATSAINPSSQSTPIASESSGRVRGKIFSRSPWEGIGLRDARNHGKNTSMEPNAAKKARVETFRAGLGGDDHWYEAADIYTPEIDDAWREAAARRAMKHWEDNYPHAVAMRKAVQERGHEHTEAAFKYQEFQWITPWRPGMRSDLDSGSRIERWNVSTTFPEEASKGTGTLLPAYLYGFGGKVHKERALAALIKEDKEQRFMTGAGTKSKSVEEPDRLSLEEKELLRSERIRTALNILNLANDYEVDNATMTSARKLLGAEHKLLIEEKPMRVSVSLLRINEEGKTEQIESAMDVNRARIKRFPLALLQRAGPGSSGSESVEMLKMETPPAVNFRTVAADQECKEAGLWDDAFPEHGFYEDCVPGDEARNFFTGSTVAGRAIRIRGPFVPRVRSIQLYHYSYSKLELYQQHKNQNY